MIIVATDRGELMVTLDRRRLPALRPRSVEPLFAAKKPAAPAPILTPAVVAPSSILTTKTPLHSVTEPLLKSASAEAKHAASSRLKVTHPYLGSSSESESGDEEEEEGGDESTQTGTIDSTIVKPLWGAGAKPPPTILYGSLAEWSEEEEEDTLGSGSHKRLGGKGHQSGREKKTRRVSEPSEADSAEAEEERARLLKEQLAREQEELPRKMAQEAELWYDQPGFVKVRPKREAVAKIKTLDATALAKMPPPPLSAVYGLSHYTTAEPRKDGKATPLFDDPEEFRVKQEAKAQAKPKAAPVPRPEGAPRRGRISMWTPELVRQ